MGKRGYKKEIKTKKKKKKKKAKKKSEEEDKNVGFYYMANACGRLIGTLTSGIAYLYGGLTTCLITSTILALAAAIGNLTLPNKSTNQDMTI